MRRWGVLVALIACGAPAVSPVTEAPTPTPTPTATATPTPKSPALAASLRDAELGASPPTPSTSTAGGEAPDNLGTHDILVVVQAASTKVKGCYDRSLSTDPNLEGRMVVHIVIAPSGKVTEARATERTTLPDGELKRCILDVMRGLVFPASATSTPVDVPFNFVRPTDAGTPADAAAPKADAGKPKP